MTRYEARAFLPVYRGLDAVQEEFVVVGGQAINLWAEYYAAAAVELEGFRPFASHDLDVVAGLACLEKAAHLFDVEAEVGDPFAKAWTPVVGQFHVDEALVQMLHTAFGVDSSSLRVAACELPFEELSLRVMHPIHCIAGKLACLARLSQVNPERQDKKHLEMAIVIMREFLREELQKGAGDSVLKYVRILWSKACEVDALKVWLDHRIAIEDAVPLESLRELGGSKTSGYLAEEMPRQREILHSRREQIEQRIATTRRRPRL